MKYSIEKITTLIGARRIGTADAQINWLLTDSRSLCFPEETLFFALKTARNDGHKYIDDLYRRGVRNFVVEQETLNSKLSTLNSKPSTLNSKLSTLNSTIHLLPYHDVGKDKHRRRGTEYNPEGLLMQAPSDETLDRCRQQFERHGISVVVGG